jgi:single-strand DNA-binding protein
MRESTEWVNVEAWERLGETCQQYLRKGSLVYVEGRLKTDKYETEGETRYFTKVVAQMVQFLDNRSSADELADETGPIGEEELDLTEAF